MRKSKIQPTTPTFINMNVNILKYPFKMITPMFGGGAHISQDTKVNNLRPVDENFPLRTTAIRGQLRFWWRAIVAPKLDTIEELQQREEEIWGSSQKPGLVATFIEGNFRVNQEEDIYEINQQGKNKIKSGQEDLAYACFPLQKGTQNQKNETLKHVDGTGFLHVHVSTNVSEVKRQEVEDAVQAWFMFGGVGGRTRRGFGSISRTDTYFSIQNIQQFIETHGIPSNQQIKIAGVPYITKSHTIYKDSYTNPMNALRFSIGKLRLFRQGVNVGRNSGQQNRPGRSRWPEPDTIRRLTRYNPIHNPTHIVRKFPRAQFGLPIIFEFKGSQGDPPKSELKPVDSERMASPLILRIIQTNADQYTPIALLLKEKGTENVQLQIKGTNIPSQKIQKNITTQESRDILPIRHFGGGATNPLDAFLHYFSL